MLRWLWLSALIILLDQLSKQWIEAVLTHYESVPLLPFFNLTLVYNTGAAFSFLADAGGWQRWFFLGLSLLVSAALAVWLARLRADEKRQAIALASIIGGALGNFIDRLLFGHVIDFLDVYYRQWHWPAFNIADAAISIGAVLLILDSLFGTRSQSDRQTDRSTE